MKPTPAHQIGLDRGTTKPPPKMVPVDQVAKTGYPLTAYRDVEKVHRMLQSLRAGQKLKPVKLIKLTPEDRDKYGVVDPSKKYYLANGHHRFAATVLSGQKKVNAIDYSKSRRI